MSADQYNATELVAGRITTTIVTALTEIAQRELGLPLDGKCGPQTRMALGLAATAPKPDLTTAAGLLAAYPTASALGCRAVEVALGLRGQGEQGSNNCGPFITAIGGDGVGGTLWCALLAGHAWRVANGRPGMPAWTYRRPGVAEPGARALVQAAILAGGKRFTDPADAMPGDLVLWKRDGGHHVALVWHAASGGVVATVEGNVGAFPARVRELSHDVRHEPHFVCFARPPQL